MKLWAGRTSGFGAAGVGSAATALRARSVIAATSAESLRSAAGAKPVLLLEQRDEQVRGRHLGVAKARRELLRSRDGLLGLDCESVCLHRTPSLRG